MQKPEDYGFTNPARTEKDVRERVRFYDNNNVYQWASISEVLGWTPEELETYHHTGKIPQGETNELPKL